MAFQRVMAEGELWLGELCARVVDGKKIALVRVAEGVFAYADRCVHLGVPISQGKLEGTTLTCTAHHYTYDACTGRGVNPKGICLTSYAVKLEDGGVWVDVTQARHT
jgi:toluene monooxygenase system ferredoxin subunit